MKPRHWHQIYIRLSDSLHDKQVSLIKNTGRQKVKTFRDLILFDRVLSHDVIDDVPLVQLVKSIRDFRIEMASFSF